MNFDIKDTFFDVDNLYKQMTDICEKENLQNTKNALPFMKEKHGGQFRKGNVFSDVKVLYIVHPLTMAVHAYSLGIREDDIFSAILLHDVCEDCGVEKEKLPVSDKAKEIVELLTFRKQDSMTKEESMSLYYKKIEDNEKAMLVKVFDRCNNVSTMSGSFTKEKIVEYMEETEKYIFPLVEKLKQGEKTYEAIVFSLEYHLNAVLETVKCLLERGL